jgi:hypothetical protein
VSTIERVRMALVFCLFFFSLMTFVAIAFRLAEPAARAGLGFAT